MTQGSTRMTAADLSHIDAWLFDLDHTLYPPECPLMSMVDARMDLYVQKVAGVDAEEAARLRGQYFLDHGTTMAGLIANHEIDPHHYLADVQDVSVDCVTPDPEMRAGIARLPGRRLVFTNAGQRYATRVLEKLGLADLFEEVFTIETANFVPKPQPATFSAIVALHGLEPQVTAFFEDTARNLEPAAAIGMTTVLVGPDALETRHAFVHHRTENLPAFLKTARVKEPS